MVFRRAKIEEGREEGQEAGQIKALRQTIADIVQVRFPDLISVTEQQVASISNLTISRRLSIEMVTAQNPEQARRILLEQQQV